MLIFVTKANNIAKKSIMTIIINTWFVFENPFSIKIIEPNFPAQSRCRGITLLFALPPSPSLGRI